MLALVARKTVGVATVYAVMLALAAIAGTIPARP